MPSRYSARVSQATIATSIVLLLVAMMLPVCHLHPLLDKGAPDHCTICVSLHAALPMGVHLPPTVRLFQSGKVLLACIPLPAGVIPHFAASRAPPAPAC